MTGAARKRVAGACDDEAAVKVKVMVMVVVVCARVGQGIPAIVYNDDEAHQIK